MRLWKWLESRPDRAAVIAEWKQAAGDQMDAVAAMLRPLERAATSYPNPRPHGQPMKVVRHGDDDIVAIDPDDYQNRIALKDADVILYQLNLRSLRSMLCETLDGVNIAKTPVDQCARVIQVGNWEPKKSASFPVYLMMCRDKTSLRHELLQLQARCDRPGAIILAPCRSHWDDDIDLLARSRKMLLVALAEVVEPDEEGFLETPAWEEYVQGFAQMVKLTLPSNYRNKKPLARRAPLMAKVDKVKSALVDHIRSARDGVVANIDDDRGARLVKFLTKSELAKLAGVEPYHVTRAFKADPQLNRLYEIANDPEQLLRYGK